MKILFVAMNGRRILDKDMKVNCATRPDGIRKDTSKDHHIFVGDLAHEVTTNELKKNFDKFGEVSEARVVRDSQTNRSKVSNYFKAKKCSSHYRAMDL